MNKSTSAGHRATATIHLIKPIRRQNRMFTEIALWEPLPSDMRGLALYWLLQMDVNALSELLPRISRPALKRSEVKNMRPTEFTQCAMFVSNALLDGTEAMERARAEVLAKVKKDNG